MDDQKFKDVYALLQSLMEHSVELLPLAWQNFAKETLQFRTTLTAETDRGCALMAAAYIDDRLGSLLRAFLVDDSKIANSLFDFNGAFGTFSARIDASYMLGLVPKNAHKDMHLLRKIRNEFAHQSGPLSFEEEPVRSRCHELTLYRTDSTSQARGKFTRSMMTAVSIIELATIGIERCQIATDHEMHQDNGGAEMLRQILIDKGFGEMADTIK